MEKEICAQWFEAARTNNIHFIQQNLNFLKQTDNKNYTALMYSVLYQHLNLFQVLQDEQGYVTPLQESAIFLALGQNDIQAIQLLAPREFMVINQQCKTPLMHAVEIRNAEAVRVLAPFYRSQKALLDEMNGGITPLIRAIQLKDHNIIQLLVNEVGYCDALNRPPIIYALQSNDNKIIEMVLKEERKHKRDGLFWIVSSGYDLVKLEYFVPLFSTRNTQDFTSLMLLGARKDLHRLKDSEIHSVQKLIIKEAALRDSQGRTALMYAAAVDNTQIVQLLLSKECRLQDQLGNTALMYACLKNSIKSAQLLSNTEKDILNKQNNTALKLSILAQNDEIARILSKVETVHTQNSAVEFAITKNNIALLPHLSEQFMNLSQREQELSFELSNKKQVLNQMKELIGEDVKIQVFQRHISWDEL